MTDNLPKHVVIIPDANRRWAKEKGLEPWMGHEEGAKNLKRILETARKMGIKYISFWGSSIDNLKKRPVRECKELIRIYMKYFSEMQNSKEVKENKIRIRVLGKWREQFPASLCRVIDKCIDMTKNFKNHNLTLFLAYSGDDEMLEAVKSIVQEKVRNVKIGADVLKNHLMTKDLPAVDLLIRTGGEPHLSAGFMMWDMANAQLHFTPTKWPDFSPKDFQKAIEEYGSKDRRFGK